MQPHKMGYPHYIQALEAERRKIQVFSRELPLSLELITQAIEACRRGTTPSECSSGQTSSESPVLEEYIFPIKKRTSSSEYCSDDDDDDDKEEQHPHKPKIAKEDKIKIKKNSNSNNTDNNKGKSDWLRSVQLWNPQSPVREDVQPKKASVLEVKRNGGAFQPFHRESSVGGKTPSSTAPPPPAASSTAAGNNVRNEKKEEKEGQSQRKQRRCWSQDLHKRFLMALHQLGGADCATPKQIREMMKVDGLTNDEVKSHLQKFRLHTRRPNHANNGNSQTGPFVIVGNIIVQPPEYATATVATSKPSCNMAAKLAAPPPSGIYAPVAAHPATVVTHAPVPAKIEFRQYSEHSNRSEVADHSNSPTSSSSTHTTSVVSHRYSI